MSIQLKFNRCPICVQVKTPLIYSNTVTFSYETSLWASIAVITPPKETTPWWNTEWVTDGIALRSSLCALALTNWHSVLAPLQCCTCSIQWPSSLSLTLSLGSLLFPSGQVAALIGVGQAAKRAAILKDHSGLKIISLGNHFPPNFFFFLTSGSHFLIFGFRYFDLVPPDSHSSPRTKKKTHNLTLLFPLPWCNFLFQVMLFSS